MKLRLEIVIWLAKSFVHLSCFCRSKSIENDLKTINSALEYTYKVNREANLALNQPQQPQQQSK